MKYDVKSINLATIDSECLILGIFADGKFSKSAQKINELTQGYVQDFLNCGDFLGSFEQTAFLYNVPNIAAKRLLLVGLGKEGELSERQYKKLNQAVFAALKQYNITSCLSCLTDVVIKQRDIYWNIRFAIETMEAQHYVFERFKSEKSTPIRLTTVCFNAESDVMARADLAVQHASAVAFGVNSTRDLANMPPNVCTPAYLSQQAKALGERSSLIKTTIINEQQMSELGMNAYLAVSQGSKNEAFLSIMEYKNHPDPMAKPIVLVGKGLTFDAGGISLKPAAEMDEMKYDMCGAASVFGVMNALEQMQLPLNVIGVMAGCENLPDGKAYRPGDILTTMKGSTIEVLNTDAEGRLVLCDVLTYVERFDPALVIDIATLTGACAVALGLHNAGLMSTDEQLAQQLEQAAQQAQDKIWRLPLGEEYTEQLKSNFADLANIGGRWGGASTAGAFLSHFTQNYPWAHLDIAGVAWLQGANKGATGRPVYLLSQFLINQVQ